MKMEERKEEEEESVGRSIRQRRGGKMEMRRESSRFWVGLLGEFKQVMYAPLAPTESWGELGQ